MRKFDEISDSQGNPWLLYHMAPDDELEPFALNWLHAIRNRGFLQWTYLDSAYERTLLADLHGFESLSNFLDKENKPHRIKTLLRLLCEAVLRLRDSLLEPDRLLLDPKLIWLNEGKHSSDMHVKLTYLPVATTVSEVAGNFEEKWQSLIDGLVTHYLHSLSPLRRKKEEVRLRKALSDGTEAFLAALQPVTEDSPTKPEVTNEQKSRPSLPLIILLAEAVLLLTIYFLDRTLGQIPFVLLLLFLGIICILCIGQVLLLFHRASPYFVLEPQTANLGLPKPVDPSLPVLPDKIALNPVQEGRTAALTLLSGQIDGQKDHSWQILGSEFLIGSDPGRCQLILAEQDTGQEVVLRICQRAGVFFAQSLSSTRTVWLQGRMLYRYEDYQLPDECQIKVGQVLLRFRAY